MRTYLAHCFGDPTAAPEIASEYSTSQFHEIARQLPISIIGNFIVVIVSVLLALRASQHVAVISSCCLILLATSGVNLALWWRYWRHPRAPRLVPAYAIRLLEAVLGVSGALYSVLLLCTFDFLPDSERVFLIGFAGAVVGISGWMYSALPLAGLLWTNVFCVLAGAGFYVCYGEQHAILAGLLGLYSIFLTSCILASSHRFVTGLIANTELTRQRELISLLLRDFEENASDWLWEIDAEGKLRHASVHLAHTTGESQNQLVGQGFMDVMRRLAAIDVADHEQYLSRLGRRLEQQASFNRLILPVCAHGQTHWWSLTGKPQFDVDRGFQGWRGVVSDITAQRLHELELAQLARFDQLTGLANRYQFRAHLDAFFPPGAAVQPCSVFLLDLDNFKAVNDTLGHSAGDELLREIGRRLQKVAIGSGMLARLGGDEFAWVVPGILPRAVIERSHRYLRQVLAEPWQYQNYSIVIRGSIGASFAPQDADNAADLMRACDMALYAAKAKGRDALCYFAREMHVRAGQQLGLLSDMRKSLADGDFELHYQPQIDLTSGKLVGFEALVRWRHPTQGMVSPLEFIALAESSGLILPLGEWVLNQACRDAAAWPDNLRVAVNVSAVQIERADMYAVTLAALQRSGLAPQRLELELTESSLSNDAQGIKALFNGLRGLGVRIALDDFGTGYSSLSYLLNFPMDKLKIDRSFITTLGADGANVCATAIVKTIVELANTLRLETIAEGGGNGTAAAGTEADPVSLRSGLFIR